MKSRKVLLSILLGGYVRIVVFETSTIIINHLKNINF